MTASREGVANIKPSARPRLLRPRWRRKHETPSGPLTAVSTILWLIPIALNLFWGTMALAIMAGLLVATILALVTWLGGQAPAASAPAAG